MKRTPIAVAVDSKGNPTVICSDGAAFFWGPDPDKVDKLEPHQRMSFEMGRLTVGHKWLPYHQPVPGCSETPEPISDAEVDEFVFGSSVGGVKDGDSSEWIFTRDAVREGLQKFLLGRAGA